MLALQLAALVIGGGGLILALVTLHLRVCRLEATLSEHGIYRDGGVT